MPFRARYAGGCAFCGATIEQGDMMDTIDGENVDGIEVENAPACASCAGLDDDGELDDEAST
jgi:hypothetical protein